MDEYFAFILSAGILTIFIATIDITKIKFAKYYKERQSELKKSSGDLMGEQPYSDYKTDEFFPIFITTLIFILSVTISLFLTEDFTKFPIVIYFFGINMWTQFKGIFFISILNSILFAGYLVQIYYYKNSKN